MQSPQLISIAAGLILALVGGLLGWLIHKRSPVTGTIIALVCITNGALLAIVNAVVFRYPDTWTMEGLRLLWMGWLGESLAIAFIAGLGLLYRKSPARGYSATYLLLGIWHLVIGSGL